MDKASFWASFIHFHIVRFILLHIVDDYQRCVHWLRGSAQTACLHVAQCVADGYNQNGVVHVTLGTVNNCLEEHKSTTVIFHPGYHCLVKYTVTNIVLVYF